ncbi:NYN domain-containing protein [Actinomadura luteofluorescens]
MPRNARTSPLRLPATLPRPRPVARMISLVRDRFALHPPTPEQPNGVGELGGAFEGDGRLAVLIDADNAQPKVMADLLAEIARYGTAHVRRAYGDWSRQQLIGWKEQLLAHSIRPMQQFAYTTGKNSTDAAMVIDAMDLLHAGRFDGFCLVSSDSDFTPLAARIRESGLMVYGFGERKKTSPAFVSACDKFIYIENLAGPLADDAPDTTKNTTAKPAARRAAKAASTSSAAPARPKQRTPTEKLKGDTGLIRMLRHAVDTASDDDGWARMADIGNIITKQHSDFDQRSWGYSKLTDLVRATTLFEIDERRSGGGKPAVVYARDKRRAMP